MKFVVLDVGHGHCSYVIADNSNLMVFDCGHKTDPEIRSSHHLHNLGRRSIELLVVTNYDEDHISDLPNIQKYVTAKTLLRNKSINAAQLRALKAQSGPISEAMEEMLKMMDGYTGEDVNPPEFPDITRRSFHNSYGQDFDDTNNISVVTFLSCRGTNILIPGDIEKAGWEKLLENAEFRNYLAGVDVFIASHHGRKNGYCPDVFRYCHPDVFVFSDDSIQYATQEMANQYAQHAKGIQLNGQTRSVLTTRKDPLTWNL